MRKMQGRMVEALKIISRGEWNEFFEEQARDTALQIESSEDITKLKGKIEGIRTLQSIFLENYDR
jgi:hypothetical protein